jgi:hypothetical protein
MQWKRKRMDHFFDRFTELIREMALLWMVFAVLDRVIAEKLTLGWALANAGIGVAGWAIAVYIELVRLPE